MFWKCFRGCWGVLVFEECGRCFWILRPTAGEVVLELTPASNAAAAPAGDPHLQAHALAMIGTVYYRKRPRAPNI